MKSQELPINVVTSDPLHIAFAMFSVLIAVLLAWPALVALAYIGSEFIY